MIRNEDDLLTLLPKEIRDVIVSGMTLVKEKIDGLVPEAKVFVETNIYEVKGINKEISDFTTQRLDHIGELIVNPEKFIEDTLNDGEKLSGSIDNHVNSIVEKFHGLSSEAVDSLESSFPLITKIIQGITHEDSNSYMSASVASNFELVNIEINGMAIANDAHFIIGK
ncbi:Nematode fatty acid retinoid binding protein (Gp-FAR-1) [Serratia plymuthica]|nr:Nematode fatty acid retinoid binding protein (Gp-FAR-1) [Serratia plymuthica]